MTELDKLIDAKAKELSNELISKIGDTVGEIGEKLSLDDDDYLMDAIHDNLCREVKRKAFSL